jgi:phosphoesterase RecJ-like protein
MVKWLINQLTTFQINQFFPKGKVMDFQKAVELIKKAKRVLLTTHIRPDGDACGCIAALCQTLTTLGKNVKILLLSELPQWYAFLFGNWKLVIGNYQSLFTSYQPDLIVIVDTDSYNQLPELDKYLKQSDKPILVIDHHATSPRCFALRSKAAGGDCHLIDSGAAATALIVFDLLKYAGWPITKKIAEALFVAVSTDTGWFQFDNTDSRALKACAELIDAGVKPAKIYRDIYQNFSLQRFKLMVAMLNTLELHFDGRYATQHLTQENFKQTGAKYSDTENLIDECRRISGVEVAALFVELADGRVKVSLRAFSSCVMRHAKRNTQYDIRNTQYESKIDVCKIAAKFGGGGHKMAAGTYLPGPIENAKKLIFNAVAEHFKLVRA